MRTCQVSPWLLFGLIVLTLSIHTSAHAQELERSGDNVASVQIGPVTYRCDRARVFATNTETGVVEDRWYVPGPCTALREQNGEVVATVGDGGGGSAETWTFDWRPSAPNARSAAMLPSSPLSFYALRKEGRLADDLYDDETALPKRAPVANGERGRYEALLAEIAARAALDPTNPWWSIDQGVVLDALGRTDEARAAFARALAIDERYAIDLMLTASTLDTFDPALGERAFERGLYSLRRAGYAPQSATWVLPMFRFLRPPGRQLDVDRDYATLARHARRVQRLAPQVEGANRFFGAMASVARRKGLRDEAALFERAQRAAGPDAILSIATPEARYAGVLLNLAIGFGWAMLLVFAIKATRGARATTDVKVRWFERFHPFLRVTGGERLGFVAAAAIAIGAAWICAWGVAEVGAIAASPVELGSGVFDHPAALKAAEEFERASVNTDGWKTWSREDWSNAWRAHVRHSNEVLRHPFRAAISVFRMSDTIGTEGNFALDTSLPSLFVMLFFVLAVLPPYRSPYRLPKPGKLSRVVDWIVPGASRFYGGFGFVFAGLIFTWALGVWMLVGSDGQAATILDAIAAPNTAGFFGARALAPQPDAPLVVLHRYGVLLIVVHIVWMATCEWRAPRFHHDAHHE